MVLPIKETPILKGKAAAEFCKKRIEIEENKGSVSVEDYKRAEKVYYEMHGKINYL